MLFARGELQQLFGGTKRERHGPPDVPFHSWQGGAPVKFSEHVVIPTPATHETRVRVNAGEKYVRHQL